MMKGKAVLKEIANMMKVASMRPTVTLKLINTAHRMIRKVMSTNIVMKKLEICKSEMKTVAVKHKTVSQTQNCPKEAPNGKKRK